MVNALRQVKNEELWAGERKWLRTLVEYGDDGIKNLLGNLTVPINEWLLVDSSGTSALSQQYDATTSRVSSRISVLVTGTHHLYKRLLVPQEFGVFPVGSLNLMARRNAAAGSMTLTLLKGGTADSTINGSSIRPAANNTWEAKSLSPGSAYSPGDFVTLDISFVSNAINDWFEVTDWDIFFQYGRGNVL